MGTAAVDGGRNFVIRNAEPAGYVFVLPNHPSKTSGNTDAAAAARVWERPADVSAVLGEVKVQLDAYPFINKNRVSMMGFSAGGYTAMSTAA